MRADRLQVSAPLASTEYVVDASVLVNLLTRAEGTAPDADPILADAATLHAPELIDLEVIQAFRRMMRTRSMTKRRAQEAIALLVEFPIHRHPHRPLVARVWEHRAGCTAYDASYLALTEGLGATLVTADAGLAHTAAKFVTVEHR